jgi:hypothetical protein
VRKSKTRSLGWSIWVLVSMRIISASSLLLYGGYRCKNRVTWDVDPIFAREIDSLNDRIRLVELLGSLSFAGDLGRGQPMGHVLRTTRIAMALADRLGVPSTALTDVYFTSLLLHAGCTAGAAEFAAFLASDELSAQKDFCLCDPNNLSQLFGWMSRGKNGLPPERCARALSSRASCASPVPA